ncbi:hypothetical protein TSAR_003849 [Trichomalopsis sarcophagae]|uniref:Uncharacterized protein n=1 Tax=Trichomalopsis sarcophagae TaxID=543379 RepID=A0A232FMF1_9HYME|nr:hypothetical protein TSAR_003849 [Trichomalopsis sarcophagae]
MSGFYRLHMYEYPRLIISSFYDGRAKNRLERKAARLYRGSYRRVLYFYFCVSLQMDVRAMENFRSFTRSLLPRVANNNESKFSNKNRLNQSLEIDKTNNRIFAASVSETFLLSIITHSAYRPALGR